MSNGTIDLSEIKTFSEGKEHQFQIELSFTKFLKW